MQSNKQKITTIVAVVVVLLGIVGVVTAMVTRPASIPVVMTEEDNTTTQFAGTTTQNYTEPTSLLTTATTVFEEVLTTTQAAVSTTVTTTKAPTTMKPSTEVPTLEDVQVATTERIDTNVVAGVPKDMTFAGLSNLGYDIIGPKSFLFNNDKDCWQSDYGYNELYDKLAPVVDMTIETCRVKFTYEDLDWMVQLWKGQYISGSIGTVGAEIGVYTKPKGKVTLTNHYDCAQPENWLKMEMTLLWTEFKDGRYIPQFTRAYTDFWWCTGFVDGQLTDKYDSSELQILARITFKNDEMTDLFEEAFAKCGFKKVSAFDPTVIDTYKRYENDIIFLWRDVR